MKTNALFTPSQNDIERLMAQHPFAQFVSVHEGTPICTPLPLLFERRDGDSWLLGHFARANPQVAMLRQQPRALAIFMGPQGYISPSWMQDRTQAPTWNYATVHLEVETEILDDANSVDVALERLVEHMEHGRPAAWSAKDMGERYGRLSNAVVAFRARVLNITAKFKLGQNERRDVYDDILRGLRSTAQNELAEAMIAAEANRRTSELA